MTMKKIQELREKTALLDTHMLHQACAGWQQRERSCLLVVVIHIAEIAKRGLHLDLGFMHLGAYCQQHLGLSEGEAWSLVHVAKASNAHPELLLALASGNISLAVAALLARHLTGENCDDLLERCAGKSKSWVEELLASMGKVQSPQRSSLRPLFVPAPPQDTSHTNTSPFSENSEKAPFVAEAIPPIAQPVKHQLVHQLRCTITNETKANLLRLAEVLGIVDPLNKLEQLIAKASEIALQAKDPALRAHKRTLEATTPTAENEAASSTPPPSPSSAGEKRSRAIPVLLRRQVLRRAEFQCEYVGIDGRRCGQKTGLEIDHQLPFSWGGEHSLQNLEVLCYPHHKRKTEEQQGPWCGRKKAV